MPWCDVVEPRTLVLALMIGVRVTVMASDPASSPTVDGGRRVVCRGARRAGAGDVRGWRVRRGPSGRVGRGGPHGGGGRASDSPGDRPDPDLAEALARDASGDDSECARP